MLGHPILGDQNPRFDVALREVGDRVAARLVQQDDVFAVGDPPVSETHPHAAAQRLGEQQPRWQWLFGEEVPHRPGSQRALLPCQTHRHVLLECESCSQNASIHDDDHLAAGFSGLHHSVRLVNLVEREDARRLGIELALSHLSRDVL